MNKDLIIVLHEEGSGETWFQEKIVLTFDNELKMKCRGKSQSKYSVDKINRGMTGGGFVHEVDMTIKEVIEYMKSIGRSNEMIREAIRSLRLRKVENVEEKRRGWRERSRRHYHRYKRKQ